MLRTSIPWREWLDVPTEVIATALDILNEQET